MTLKKTVCAVLLTTFSLTTPTFGAGDPARGAQVFRACVACHSLEPGIHLTGPSLANLFGHRAGTAEGFTRYSEALRNADVTWNEKTLDAWIAKPQKLIPGNFMTFSGISDTQPRADLIAFLKAAKSTGASSGGGMGGKMTSSRFESLRDVEPQARVTAIRYCKDSYFVTLANGKTFPFWELNLRFKTNGGSEGPSPNKPVILRAGMQGDRASIVFANPDEISKLIRKRCE
jgi:cytochrome c